MFKKILPAVLKLEGGFVNHPADKGGATNQGVTQKVYDNFRNKLKLPLQSVQYITSEEVEQIYYSYWTGARCDVISKSRPNLSALVFDCAINSGPKTAARLLQKVVGAKPVDGVIGPVTLGALSKSSDTDLCFAYLEARTDFYADICMKDKSQVVFLKGWLRRLNHLRRVLNEWSGTGK